MEGTSRGKERKFKGGKRGMGERVGTGREGNGARAREA